MLRTEVTALESFRLTRVQSEAYEWKTARRCCRLGRNTESRKLRYPLLLVTPVTLMVVLYHSVVGRFGEKLAKPFVVDG
jgi:hypothetical protein